MPYIRRRRLFKWNLRRVVSEEGTFYERSDSKMSSFLIDSLIQGKQPKTSPVSPTVREPTPYNMMPCTYCWTPQHDKINLCQLCIPGTSSISSYAMPVRSQVIPATAIRQNMITKDYQRLQNPFRSASESGMHLDSNFGMFTGFYFFKKNSRVN